MEYNLTLNKDDALILFEFLSRIGEKDYSFTSVFVDKSEQQALWRLEGQLQKALVEPCYPNYFELVQAARDRARYSEE